LIVVVFQVQLEWFLKFDYIGDYYVFNILSKGLQKKIKKKKKKKKKSVTALLIKLDPQVELELFLKAG